MSDFTVMVRHNLLTVAKADAGVLATGVDVTGVYRGALLSLVGGGMAMISPSSESGTSEAAGADRDEEGLPRIIV